MPILENKQRWARAQWGHIRQISGENIQRLAAPSVHSRSGRAYKCMERELKTMNNSLEVNTALRRAWIPCFTFSSFKERAHRFTFSFGPKASLEENLGGLLTYSHRFQNCTLSLETWAVHSTPRTSWDLYIVPRYKVIAVIAQIRRTSLSLPNLWKSKPSVSWWKEGVTIVHRDNEKIRYRDNKPILNFLLAFAILTLCCSSVQAPTSLNRTCGILLLILRNYRLTACVRSWSLSSPSPYIVYFVNY